MLDPYIFFLEHKIHKMYPLNHTLESQNELVVIAMYSSGIEEGLPD